MTLPQSKVANQAGDVGLEELNAGHETARWLLRFGVTPIFLTWKLRLRENGKAFFSLPPSFPAFLLSFPSFLLFSLLLFPLSLDIFSK